MVPANRAVTTFYMLSILTMCPSAVVVWPQFWMECLKL